MSVSESILLEFKRSLHEAFITNERVLAHFLSFDRERLLDLEKERDGLWFLSRDRDLSLLRSREKDLLRLRLKLLLRGDLRTEGATDTQ